MFSFRRAEVLPVECYGKLPIAKDYLRVGCAEGAGAAWREWLDRAYSGGTGGTFPELAWPANFVTGEAWGEPLVGGLWPSSDAGGLRKFPFTLLVERRRKAARGDLDEGWSKSAAIWRELGALRANAESSGDGQRFLAAMRGRELDLDTLEGTRESGIDFATWRAAIDAGEDGLEKTLRRLSDLRRGGPRAVLRLPLVSNMDARGQARAWCSLCRSIGVLDPDRLPTILFPAGETSSAAFVVLAARVFAPSDTRWLEPPAQTGAAGLEDLCDERVRVAALVPECAQPLANSLLGAWTSLQARGA